MVSGILQLLSLVTAISVTPQRLYDPLPVSTVTIGHVSDSRFQTGYALDGVHGNALRNALTNPSNFAAIGGVQPARVRLRSIETVTPEALAGVDILVIGSVPADAPNMFSEDELGALRDFYRFRGILVFTTDDPVVWGPDETSFAPWWKRFPFTSGTPFGSWNTFSSTVSPIVGTAGFRMFTDPPFGEFSASNAIAVASPMSFLTNLSGASQVAVTDDGVLIAATSSSSDHQSYAFADKRILFSPTAERVDQDSGRFLLSFFAQLMSSFGSLDASTEMTPNSDGYFSGYAEYDLNNSASGLLRGALNIRVPSFVQIYGSYYYANNEYRPCTSVSTTEIQCGDESSRWESYAYMYFNAQVVGPTNTTDRVYFTFRHGLAPASETTVTGIIKEPAPPRQPPTVTFVDRSSQPLRVATPPNTPATDSLVFDVQFKNPNPEPLWFYYVTINTTALVPRFGSLSVDTGSGGFTCNTARCGGNSFEVPGNSTVTWTVTGTAASEGPFNLSIYYYNDNNYDPSVPYSYYRSLNRSYTVLPASGDLFPLLRVGAFTEEEYLYSFAQDSLSETMSQRAAFQGGTGFSSVVGFGVAYDYIDQHPFRVQLSDLAKFDVILMSAGMGGEILSLNPNSEQVLLAWVRAGGTLIVDAQNDEKYYFNNRGFYRFLHRLGVDRSPANGSGSATLSTASGIPAFFGDATYFPALDLTGTTFSFVTPSMVGFENWIDDTTNVVVGRKAYGLGQIVVHNSSTMFLGNADTSATSGIPALFSTKLLADIGKPKARALSTTVAGPLASSFLLPLAVENFGRLPLKDIVVDVSLPTGLDFVSVDPSATNVNCTATGVPPAVTHQCTLQGDLRAASSRVVLLRVNPTAPGPFTVTHQFTVSTPVGEDSSDNTGTTQVTLTQPIDVQLTAGNLPETLAPNQSSTVSLTVKNNAGSAAANVHLAVSFTPNATPLVAPAGCTESQGRLSCAIGALGAGESRSFDVQLAVDSAQGNRSFAAAVTHANFDPVASNNVVTKQYGLGSPPSVPSQIVINQFAPLFAKNCSQSGQSNWAFLALVALAARAGLRRRR